MQLIKQLRINLGLSQDAMAEWLEISRPYLVKVERGNCSLSHEAILHLEAIYNCMQQIAAEGTQRENAFVENQEMLNAYARRLKNCRWYLAANQRKLGEMQEAFKTCTKLNRVLDRLKVLTPARKPWIEDQQYKLAQKLASCNEAAQAPVKKQVHLLIAEAAYLSFIPGVESIRG